MGGALGLVAVPIGAFDDRTIQLVLSLSTHVRLLCLVPVGESASASPG